MALFPHYETETDLPKEKTKFEVDNCDFKTWYRPHERRQMAKCIAAFANAFGGVLLFGAKEEGQQLVEYDPKTEAEAVELRAMALDVATKICVPRVQIDPKVIPKGAGFVVVVDVYGSVAQPIGVKVEKEPDAYKFPIRVGSDTEYLKPQELAKIMVPEIRARALVLEHLPPDKRLVSVDFSGINRKQMMFEKVDPHMLQAHFSYDDNQKNRRILAVPLDQITAVSERLDQAGNSSWDVYAKGIILDVAGGIFRWSLTRS